MAAGDTQETPTGQKPANDGAALGFQPNTWRPWEQNGLSTSVGYDVGGGATVNEMVQRSMNPIAHYAWRKARSDDNKTKPTLYDVGDEPLSP